MLLISLETSINNEVFRTYRQAYYGKLWRELYRISHGEYQMQREQLKIKERDACNTMRAFDDYFGHKPDIKHMCCFSFGAYDSLLPPGTDNIKLFLSKENKYLICGIKS
jgi:hypothetical protein